ncbi:hypothetical protein T265_14450, partial [Opisthorchis viverrini]
ARAIFWVQPPRPIRLPSSWTCLSFFTVDPGVSLSELCSLTISPYILDSLKLMDKQQPVLSSRNQARITPGAVVCSECELCGEVVIGAGTIVHPKARIVAEAGPIHIGAFNLIEEQVEIINHTPDTVLKIGDHNVFEVGARCEAMEIGDNNVFEAKSCVGPHMRITNGCVIGAMCSLMSDETLPECTVIYGEQDLDRRFLPNYVRWTLRDDNSLKVSLKYCPLEKLSSAMNETLLPGESGSVAEVLGSSGGIGHSSSTEPTDAATATALTAAFHFTGTSASANGATMQEYFIQNSGVQISAGKNPVNLECADDVIVFEDQGEAQALLNKLTTVIPSFSIRLVPSMQSNASECAISEQTLTIQGESPEVVENFACLGSCISSDGIVSDEVIARISRAWITFADWRHLWLRKDISLDLKCRMYHATSVVSSPQQHELLVTRLRGLSREWSEFCDQEISFQLGSEDRGDSASVPRSISGSTTSAGVLSTVAPAATSSMVNVRLRRSLLPAMQFPDRRLSALRYLGAVETDRTVSRRSCLEVPVTGPLVCFLQELGFEPEFTYVAEGLIFIRGRVKVCVYTVNEVVQFESPVPSMPGTDGISGQDSYPKEWRRVCPNSWLVEISAVGSPADESLQDEVAEFADLLFPVIVPGKLDNSLFMRK